MLQEHRWRERWGLSDGYLVIVMDGGIACVSQKLVVPLMVHDRLVVLVRVLPEKMSSEIRIPGARCVEIIGYFLGNSVLIGAMDFPATC